MSTAVKQSAIPALGAERRESLACLGHPAITQVGKISASGNYMVQPILLEGVGGSPNHVFYFLYRPEWFRHGFEPKSIDDAGMAAVYRRYINEYRKLSALKALAGGTDEAFEELGTALLSIPEVTPEAVSAVLSEFFAEKKPLVGYILRQRFDRVEGHDGSVQWIPTEQYQVGSWFVPTEDEIRRLRSQEKKGKLVVAFQEDLPF
jgi:hypothetical protein